jgi:hypothetical protein
MEIDDNPREAESQVIADFETISPALSYREV